MIQLLPRHRFTCHVALPGPSPMAAEFAQASAVLHVVPMRRISTSHSIADWFLYAVLWPVSVLRLWRLARAVHADVVDSNSLHSWYGWAVARLASRPHVWHAREIVEQSAAALRVERFLTRHFATRLVAMSEAIAAQFDSDNVEVVIEDMERPREDLHVLRALVWVEAESQKGILIGHGGRMIKAIGTAARRELERELGTRVHLDLSVRVRRSWRADEALLDRLGIE